MKRGPLDAGPHLDGAAHGTFVMAALLPVLTLLFFGPIFIFLANADQFPTGLSSLLPLQALLAVVALGVFFLAFVTLPQRFRPLFAVLTAAVGLLLWLQGQVLVWRYENLDGTAIPWSRHFFKGVLDGTVWTVVLGLAAACRRRLLRWVRGAALFLILLQAGVLLLIGLKSPPPWRSRPEPGAARFRYSFSSDRNVLLLILDEFQPDVFADLVREDPGLAAPFDGFTFFRDALAGYPNTAASVPFIMTGRYYDNSEPRSRYMRREYRRHSIPQVLWANGFRLDMYPRPDSGDLVRLPEDWLQEPRSGSPWRSAIQTQALLLDVAFFRYAPHFFKPLIHGRQRWLLSRLANQASEAMVAGAIGRPAQAPVQGTFPEYGRELVRLGLDFQFLNSFMSHARVGGPQPVFKYYHWNAVHPPLAFDESFRVTRAEFGRAAFASQARACLKMAGRFLAKIKEIGVYDRTLMVILSDHGSGRTPDLLVNPSLGDRSRSLAAGNPYRDFHFVKSRACALLLVKPLASRGPLRTSLAPVSHLDVAPTIFAGLGVQARGFAGWPAFSVPENAVRRRRFLAYNWTGHHEEYLAPLVEYQVRGDCWDDNSWNLSGRIFAATK